jgi:DNA polymerase-4
MYGNIEELEKIVTQLAQKVSYRLRKENMYANVVNVQLKINNFKNISHQKKMNIRTDTTKDILDVAKELLRELYNGELIRLVGVRVDGLVEKEELQLSIFDMPEDTKNKKIDEAMDKLKEKFGYEIITRATDIKCNKEWK